MEIRQLKEYGEKVPVLFVEDEEPLREQVGKFLRKIFPEVDVAGNGEEGLALFREKRHPIVITDIVMPRMDGLEMAKGIRELSGSVSIVVLSAFNDEKNLLRAIDLGISHYVRKPVEGPRLLQVFAECLEKIARKEEAERLHLLVETMFDMQREMVMLTDGATVKRANRAFREFFGWDGREVEGQGTGELDLFIVMVDGKYYDHLTLAWAVYLLEMPQEEHVVMIHDPGENEGRAFLVRSARLPESGDFIVSFADISRMEKEQMELRHRLYVDETTHAATLLKLKLAMENALAMPAGFTARDVALVAFDGCGRMRKELGDLRVDRSVTELAALVMDAAGPDDVVGRWNDGRLLVLTGPGGDGEKLAETIRRKVEAHSFQLAEGARCSCGVTTLREGDCIEGVLERAGRALREAEQKGGNRVEREEE